MVMGWEGIKSECVSTQPQTPGVPHAPQTGPQVPTKANKVLQRCTSPTAQFLPPSLYPSCAGTLFSLEHSPITFEPLLKASLPRRTLPSFASPLLALHTLHTAGLGTRFPVCPEGLWSALPR